MVTAHRTKSIDKQEVCRKVTTLLKKAYPAPVPKRELPVLETMLYAACLEDATYEQADAVYAKLLNSFHDLNEARVSSITELARVFVDADHADWRAMRVKNTLQYVFETCYAFEWESLRKKTAELAQKQLSKIYGLTSFIRQYVMQHCLESHVLPIDSRMHAALLWLGLAEPDSTPEHTGETLRSFVRKADAPLFCHLLHCLATDAKRSRAFASLPKRDANGNSAGADPVARLDHLLRHGPPVERGKSAKRPAAKPAKRATAGDRAGKSRLGTKKRH